MQSLSNESSVTKVSCKQCKKWQQSKQCKKWQQSKQCKQSRHSEKLCHSVCNVVSVIILCGGATSIPDGILSDFFQLFFWSRSPPGTIAKFRTFSFYFSILFESRFTRRLSTKLFLFYFFVFFFILSKRQCKQSPPRLPSSKQFHLQGRARRLPTHSKYKYKYKYKWNIDLIQM